jgi:hypothetical protein
MMLGYTKQTIGTIILTSILGTAAAGIFPLSRRNALALSLVAGVVVDDKKAAKRSKPACSCAAAAPSADHGAP